MSVGDIPECEYITNSFLEDLAGISTSKKAKQGAGSPFYTDIATVGLPDYHYLDYQRIMLEKPPAALLWLFGLGASERGDSHKRRPMMRALVVGFVSQPLNTNRGGPRFESDLQRKAMRLWDDIDRIALGNPMRNHPQAAGAVNEYGVLTANTQTGLPANFEPMTPAGGVGALIFGSLYDITYRATF